MKTCFPAIFAALFFFSCSKKDKDPAPITPTKENLAGSYKTEKVTAIYSGSSFEVNITNSVMPDSCDRDDIIKVNTDNTVNFIDAGLVCSPSNSYNSTWNLTSSTTFDLDGKSYTIRRWDGTNLEATYAYSSNTTGVIYLKKI